jgi:hypothetical protein
MTRTSRRVRSEKLLTRMSNFKLRTANFELRTQPHALSLKFVVQILSVQLQQVNEHPPTSRPIEGGRVELRPRPIAFTRAPPPTLHPVGCRRRMTATPPVQATPESKNAKSPPAPGHSPACR